MVVALASNSQISGAHANDDAVAPSPARTDASAPAASGAPPSRTQVRSWPAAVHVHGPPLTTNENPAGRVSVTVIGARAADGPALRTAMVQVDRDLENVSVGLTSERPERKVPKKR